MSLLYARVVEVLPADDGPRMGKVSVGGVLTTIALELVADARPGDMVLVCDGVALSKVRPDGDAVKPKDP
jgi:hydrogenase maturation factor